MKLIPRSMIKHQVKAFFIGLALFVYALSLFGYEVPILS